MAESVTKEQIEERLTKALVEFGAEEDQVNRDAEFESLDVDSLDLVEMAQIVEEEWGVELKTEDLKDLKTVGQAVDLVDSKTS
jgi:acyl carrier protein